MRILVPSDIPTDISSNSFGYQLLRSLSLHPETVEVQHGIGWFFEKDLDYEIILFQWPEMLFSLNEPDTDELNKLHKQLRYWKGRSKIAVTVHNQYPHYRDTKPFRKLYDLVFSFADGFIHMGKASKSVMRNRYKEYFDAAMETIIPHGNYLHLPNGISKEKARSRLGFNKSDKILLCFGSLRAKEELTLLKKAFGKVKKQNSNLILLIAGRLPVRSKRKISYYTSRLLIRLNPTIKHHEGYIKAKDIQIYAKAADVFIIPRVDALNSGNVQLGFSFGRVVTGPDKGVIGEELSKNGNPVFNPENINTVSNAILRAFELSKTNSGEVNRKYAEEKLDWSIIGEKYISFFKNLS